MSQNSTIEANTTRNSHIRELVKKPVAKAVETIDQIFPWLTPNMITALGTTGVLCLAIYTGILEKKGRIDLKTSSKLIAIFFALSVSDALDGGLARHRADNGNEPHDPKVGQLVDALSDRLQEAFLSWMAMYRADAQGDELAKKSSLVTALTNPLSSFFRAWAEENGAIVPENGKGLFDAFGTRVGKVIASSVRFLPAKKKSGVSVQVVVDILVVVATLKVAVGRFKAAVSDPENDVDRKLIEGAEARKKWFGGLMVATIGGTVALSLFLKNKDK